MPYNKRVLGVIPIPLTLFVQTVYTVEIDRAWQAAHLYALSSYAEHLFQQGNVEVAIAVGQSTRGIYAKHDESLRNSVITLENRQLARIALLDSELFLPVLEWQLKYQAEQDLFDRNTALALLFVTALRREVSLAPTDLHELQSWMFDIGAGMVWEYAALKERCYFRQPPLRARWASGMKAHRARLMGSADCANASPPRQIKLPKSVSSAPDNAIGHPSDALRVAIEAQDPYLAWFAWARLKRDELCPWSAQCNTFDALSRMLAAKIRDRNNFSPHPFLRTAWDYLSRDAIAAHRRIRHKSSADCPSLRAVSDLLARLRLTGWEQFALEIARDNMQACPNAQGVLKAMYEYYRDGWKSGAMMLAHYARSKYRVDDIPNTIAYPRPACAEVVQHIPCRIPHGMIEALSAQESLHLLFVESHAGAVGRYQILPSTALAFARLRGLSWGNWDEESTRLALFRPSFARAVAIELVCDAARRWGDWRAALVEYNGGGMAALAWLQGNPIPAESESYLSGITYLLSGYQRQ